MKIAVASDHRGFSMKSKVVSLLKHLSHESLDYGPENADSVDYPDFAEMVADAVSNGKVDSGILICGTATGMCITANKFPGVRAASCHDELTAQMSRLHNDANVLCLSGDLLGDRLVGRMVEVWLNTNFEGGRHARRVEKITTIEARNMQQGKEECGATPSEP